MTSTFQLDLIRKQTQSNAIVISVYSDYNQNPISYRPDIIIDLQTIKQSLDNLFHCKKYQRRYMYDYYVPVDELIGELYGTAGPFVILNKIKTYVEYNEPRVVCIPSLSKLTFDSPNAVRLDLVHEVAKMQTGAKYIYSTDLKIITS